MGILVKYLLRTTIVGGLVGATHGSMTVHLLPSTDFHQQVWHIASHAQLGAIIGPWLPIAIPIWLSVDGSGNDTRCYVMKGGIMFKQKVKSEISGHIPTKLN